MNIKPYNYLLICILGGATALLSAQSTSAPPPQYEVAQSAFLNNLPVNDITIDFSNTVWVGTEKGLFTLRSIADSPSLEREKGVFSSVMGQNEIGWIAFYDNTIGMFDRNATYNTGIRATDMVYDVAIENKLIWLGTSDGLHKISLLAKEESKHYTAENAKLPHNRIQAIAIDAKGIRWIGTANGLVLMQRDRFSTFLKTANITAIAVDRSDVWVAGSGSLWKIDENLRVTELPLIEEFRRMPIEDIAFDSKGNVWLAGGLLGRYDQNWIPYIYDAAFGFTSTHALCLAVDAQDRIWVGTAGKGLFCLQEKASTVAPAAMVALAAPNDQNALAAANPSLAALPPADPLSINTAFIGNRIIKPGKEAEVEDQRVQIAVWDGQAVDGDSISLIYNGKILLDRVDLTNERVVLSVDVLPNTDNQLVLYAHNNGSLGVNTAMVALIHRDRPRDWIVLTSDSQRCDKVKFKLVKDIKAKSN